MTTTTTNMMNSFWDILTDDLQEYILDIVRYNKIFSKLNKYELQDLLSKHDNYSNHNKLTSYNNNHKTDVTKNKYDMNKQPNMYTMLYWNTNNHSKKHFVSMFKKLSIPMPKLSQLDEMKSVKDSPCPNPFTLGVFSYTTKQIYNGNDNNRCLVIVMKLTKCYITYRIVYIDLDRPAVLQRKPIQRLGDYQFVHTDWDNEIFTSASPIIAPLDTIDAV